MTRVVFVTPNQGRQAEVQRLLADIEVELSRLGPPVAPGLDLAATAASRAQQAFASLQRPCFVENTAFELGGEELRGAELKDRLADRGEADFCARHAGQRASVRVVVALATSAEPPVLFTGAIDGTVAAQPRGEGGWGWDRVFVPEGYARTLDELGASKYLVNMRHAPYLDLADHLRGRSAGGAYEAHITVKDGADHAVFAAVCDALGVKCVLIELPGGETVGQPMTASVHRGVLREVQDEVHAIARQLVARGFEVTRTKIEALPRNADWPESDADAAARPAGYYEFHVKLALPAGDAHALARATAAADRHGARLSRNANSRARGETEHRFVTLRVPGRGRLASEARFDALVQELEALGYPLRARIREYTVYDSHVAVDRGWL